MKKTISNQLLYTIVNEFKDDVHRFNKSKLWSSYLSSGSHLWMDTGDFNTAQTLWSSEFSALTTNNTLLNNEVQKGVYDLVITKLASELGPDDENERVKEIGLCINAIHGLRLAKQFNCKVSVELHTNLADDIEGTFDVGSRLYAICKDHFIIKVPFTAGGLLGARKLHDKGIPVNQTLGFSTRQNVLASMIAKATYCNVFVGRIGAYFANNKLGDDLMIGERVTKETQKCLRKVNERGYATTKLIAASIRSAKQLMHVVGADVLTIPVNVISEASSELIEADHSSIAETSEQLHPELVQQLNLKHLWQVNDQEKELAKQLTRRVPSTAEDMIALFNHYGSHDIFPMLNDEELTHLKKDGKIPIHNKWASKIENFEIGIDTLLNKAGLYAFKNDQKALDDRIKSFL